MFEFLFHKMMPHVVQIYGLVI